MADDDGFHFPLDYEQQLPAMDPLSSETQCQFILKRNEKMTNRIPIGKTTSSKMKQGVICKTAKGEGRLYKEMNKPNRRRTIPKSYARIFAHLLAFLLSPLFIHSLFRIHFLHVRQSFSKILGKFKIYDAKAATTPQILHI